MAEHASPQNRHIAWPWLLTVLLLVIPVVLFAPALMQDKLIYGWDTAGEYAHWRPWVFRYLKLGIIPFYNPHLLSGYPLLLDPQQAPFYVPNWLYAFMPFHRAYAWSLLGHTFWAGLGVYHLARSLGAGRGQALAAALCWQGASLFQGQMVLGGVPQHCTLAWAAWVGVVTLRLWKKPTFRRASLWAMVTGLTFFSGHTQFAWYAILSALMFLLVIYWQSPGERGRGLGRSVAVALVLTAGVVMVQAVMAWHLKGMSTRQEGMDPIGDNTAMTVLHLLGFFMPTAQGEETRRYYWGLGVQNLWVPFMGVLWPWLWLSRWRQSLRHGPAAAAFAVGLVALVMGAGFPVLNAVIGFKTVPGLNLMRAPTRWWALACLWLLAGGAVLWTQLHAPRPETAGAEEIGEGQNNAPTPGELNPGWLWFPAGILLLGVVLWALPGGVKGFLDFYYMNRKLPAIANIHPVYPSALLAQVPRDLMGAGALTLVWMAVCLLLWPRQGKPWVLALLVAWCALPGAWLSQRMVLLVNPQSAHFSPALVRQLKTLVGEGRFASLTPAHDMPMPHWVRQNWWWNHRYAQLDYHAGILHGLSSAGGYVSLPPADYLDLAVGFHPKNRQPLGFDWNNLRDRATFDLLGVRAVLLPVGSETGGRCEDFPDPAFHLGFRPSGENLDNFSFCGRERFHAYPPEVLNNQTNRHLVQWFGPQVGQFGSFKVYQNSQAMPLVWPLREGVAFQTWEWSRRNAFQHDWELTGENFYWNSRGVPSYPILKHRTKLGIGESLSLVRSANPNVFFITAQIKKSRRVVFSVPFDTGWRASVGGRPLAIQNAYVALSAIRLPAGRHTVRFDYRPPLFGTAAAVSVLALLTCLLLQALPYAVWGRRPTA